MKPRATLNVIESLQCVIRNVELLLRELERIDSSGDEANLARRTRYMIEGIQEEVANAADIAQLMDEEYADDEG